MHIVEDLLTEADVAKKLRVTLACLRRWRLERRGPKFIKLGALVRYRPDDIVAWLESRPAGGTPAKPPDASRDANLNARKASA
jgi:predicted DNA-binding transcriptional regulator AlpA